MRRASHVALQGTRAGLRAKVPFWITPGSERIYQTIKRDGLIDVFARIGGTRLANARGPGIGQWERRDARARQAHTNVSSVNPDLPPRDDRSAAPPPFPPPPA